MAFAFSSLNLRVEGSIPSRLKISPWMRIYGKIDMIYPLVNEKTDYLLKIRLK
ncbi:MAG: hypothetical protein FWC06_08205 [Treponema sp.]|nr:hypothetical protein [Treponema sp.]